MAYNILPHKLFTVGAVYLSDTKRLKKIALEVHSEFLSGNCTVKRTQRRFNQVPVDQAIEWINRTCEMHNGITRNDKGRSKCFVT